MKTNETPTRKVALFLAAVCAVMLATTNQANATRLPAPAINLSIGDGHELGTVTPSISQGDAAITQYVNFMIGLPLGGSGHVNIGPHNNLVTRSNNNFGTLPSPAVLALRGTSSMTINLGIAGTYDYLFAHYGGPGGGFSEVWFIGDLSGTIMIPGTANGHGLSGWALFTAGGQGVPDGGATVMLLGAALGALGVVRRSLRTNR
jgi:hypothetical protein